MDRLCRDASPLVRVPALEALGPFIAACGRSELSARPPLLPLFAGAATPPPLLTAQHLPDVRQAVADHLAEVGGVELLFPFPSGGGGVGGAGGGRRP